LTGKDAVPTRTETSCSAKISAIVITSKFPVTPLTRKCCFFLLPIPLLPGNTSSASIGNQGEFEGVITATLDPEYFSALLSSTIYTPDNRVSLVHGDGTVFIAVPEARFPVTGVKVTQPGSAFLQHISGGTPTSVRMAAGKTLGDQRIFAYRTNIPNGMRFDRQIIVAASRNLHEVLAVWRMDAAIEAAVILLFVSFSIVVTRDMLQRGIELKRLEETKAHLAAIVEFSDDAIISKDMNGVILSWNAGAERLFAYTPDEAVGRSISMIIPPELQDEENRIQQSLKAGEPVKHLETVRIAKDGRRIDVSVTSSPLLDNTGTVIGASKIIRNTTERKLAEQKLLESQAQLQAAHSRLQIATEELEVQNEELQNQNQELQELWERSRQAEASLLESRHDLDRAQEVGSIGSWRLDVRINVLTWSDENYRIFGLPIGTPLTYETFLSTIHPDDLHYVNTRWNAGLRGEPYDIEHRLLVNGQVKWVREKAYLEFEEDGTLIGGFGITQDITARKKAEEALRQSEFFFKESQRAASIGSYKIDFVTGRWESSEVLDAIFGIDQEYTRSVQGWLDLVHPDDRDVMDHYLREEVIAKRAPFSREYRIIRKNDGETRWVLGLGEVAFDGNDTLLSLTGTIQDITTRKQAEEALRESEKRHRVLAETMLQGVVHQDASGTIISMNPAAERILGKSREDFLGINSIDVEHDTIRENGQIFPGMEHPTMVALRTGVPVHGVTMGVFNPKLDEYRWITIDAVPVFRSEEDFPSEVYSVFEDITERRQSELALQASEERIQQALHVSRSFTFDWVTVTDQVIRSASCATILNLTGDEVINDTGEHFFQCIHPDDRARFEQILGDLAPSSDSYLTEYRYVSKDGREIMLEETGRASFDDTGRMQRIVGVSTDVTLRKNAELALKTAYDELEQRIAKRTQELADSINLLQNEILEREVAQEFLRKETAERIQAMEVLREKEQMLIQQSRQAAMGEMIGNIAHQWRQPLNTLGLYTQKLGMLYGTPSFNKELLDVTISKSMKIIRHMSKTIDDFRDYFKPEKEKADFHLIDAIKSTLSLLEGNFNNPKITIDLVEHESPVINGYQNEFAQVILNILNNARDAIIEREIHDARVTIEICNENNCAVVSVADNAGGIPDEVIDKVFDPYFTTKGPQVGTGIGLFMSKNIIEKNMGGRLTVRNTETGAEFRIEVVHGTQN